MAISVFTGTEEAEEERWWHDDLDDQQRLYVLRVMCKTRPIPQGIEFYRAAKRMLKEEE
jgi:hypothetical protein